MVAEGLELETWYTITIEANVPEGFYTDDGGGGEGTASNWNRSTPRAATPGKITHLSFASWNDGAGTFYVDNVSAVSE